MNVLSIGSDRSIANPRSVSAQRQIAYGTRLGELNIIIFSLRSQKIPMQTLAIGVRVYPTNSSNRLFYLWDAFRIARQLPRPDVVSVQDPFETGLVGLCIAWSRRVPLHVQVHTDFLSPSFATHSSLNRIRIRLAGFVLRRASRIRVVSPRIKGGIEKYYAPKAPITVLPIFVDIARFKTAQAGDLTVHFKRFSPKILVVSRLEPEKNIALALSSFELSAPPNACLIILGEGSERKNLERMTGGERIFFQGEQDPAPYYALADLVLFPSLYDGYGRTIIETLAAGKPVLSTDVGIAREAGAIVAGQDYAASLREWFQNGARIGTLKDYPYTSFDDYVERYCGDISATLPASPTA